ncbi:hypothetical protein RAS1_40960 [Phycisphaerae bacterium RAS1]|nr:hypothetical protein RAS1_40960 [Phycisphaerae bacterium RAS1]
MTRLSAIYVTVFFVGAALADNSAVIDLTGVQIRNATNQSRNSGADTIDAGFGYRHAIDGLVRGQGGVLGTLFPNPTPLATVLESLAPGSSAALNGESYNASGALPFETVNQRTDGSTVLLGITVTYGLTLSAGIQADGVAYFAFTDVVLTPSFLVGSLLFTSGSATLTRIPAITGDMNRDGSVNVLDINDFVFGLSDPIGYEAAYGVNPIYAGDVNRDGFFDVLDINPFVALLAE